MITLTMYCHAASSAIATSGPYCPKEISKLAEKAKNNAAQRSYLFEHWLLCPGLLGQVYTGSPTEIKESQPQEGAPQVVHEARAHRPPWRKCRFGNHRGERE